MSDWKARYWAKVQRAGPDECWLWTGAKTPKGYGKLKLPHGFAYAHRLALCLEYGAPAETDIALHSCNNPSCVNPRHLRWGSYVENNRQAIELGRAPRRGRVAGERNGNAILTEEKVRAIRADPRQHMPVAHDYGVSRSLVSQIRLGTAWKHVL